MALIQLRHDSRLKYSATNRKALPTVPEALLKKARGSTVLTFRPLQSGRADEVRRRIHACVRLRDLPDGDMELHGLESDSPLAPLLVWDAAHLLKKGDRITISGEVSRDSILDRDYYKVALAVEHRDAARTVYRKVAELPAESNAGLDRWTFGIPVGPEDATLLNAVVKRILEFDFLEKEILLCGRPGANFQYLDKVRIVGEEITAPPLQISRKKNRLVAEAKFENVCILHDRVFLPSNFAQVVRSFGDSFPFVGFQSVFFDDRFNFVPRRYSDAGIAPHVSTKTVHGVSRDLAALRIGLFNKSVLPATENSVYAYANPMRYSPFNYLTGSLYICKKAVWQLCPQDESLHWAEFEDVEQGFRGNALGIPSRINPFAITQSIISRPLLIGVGGVVHFELADGSVRTGGSRLSRLPLPRKPLIKVSHDKVRDNARVFQETYVPISARRPVASNLPLRTRSRLLALYRLAYGACLPIRRTEVGQFVKDVEKFLIMDQLPESLIDHFERDIIINGNLAVRSLLEHDVIVNHAAQRPRGKVFPKSMGEYFVRRNLLLRAGSLVSALSMRIQHRKMYFVPGGFWQTYRTIMRSTPFDEYLTQRQK